MSAPLPLVEIWTDGFCWPNPGGSIGLGVVLRCNSAMRELLEGAAPEPRNTNNAAELSAVLLALRSLTKPCQAIVFTDSKYVADGWASWLRLERRDRPNAILFHKIEGAASQHSLTIEWVRGGESELNRLADRLSQEGALPHLPSRAQAALHSWPGTGKLYEWMLRHTR
jgi:ribonuclease HI